MAAGIPLDGNSFFFYNKEYNQARMGLDSNNAGSIRSYEQDVMSNQIWMMKSDDKHPGYYYICNCGFEGYRLAKPGPNDGQLGGYNGQYYTDQLWKFVKEGDFYRIYNLHYPSAKLLQGGKGDWEIRTFTGDNYNDQLWKLVPRFEVDVMYDVIWHADNRQGSEPYSETISVTQGIKLTQSSTVSTQFGFSTAMKTAAEAGILGNTVSMEASMEMHSQIDKSMSQGSEETWSETTSTTFAAPPGKNYRVKQLKGCYTSVLKQDNNNLSCSYVIEETDGEFTN